MIRIIGISPLHRTHYLSEARSRRSNAVGMAPVTPAADRPLSTPSPHSLVHKSHPCSFPQAYPRVWRIAGPSRHESTNCGKLCGSHAQVWITPRMFSKEVEEK